MYKGSVCWSGHLESSKTMSIFHAWIKNLLWNYWWKKIRKLEIQSYLKFYIDKFSFFTYIIWCVWSTYWPIHESFSKFGIEVSPNLNFVGRCFITHVKINALFPVSISLQLINSKFSKELLFFWSIQKMFLKVGPRWTLKRFDSKALELFCGILIYVFTAKMTIYDWWWSFFGGGGGGLGIKFRWRDIASSRLIAWSLLSEKPSFNWIFQYLVWIHS